MAPNLVKKAVIPVAGLGTRFLPATKVVPKEMLPIVDVPMIQYIVEEAVRSGIEDIVLITARHKEAIENHFDAHPELERFLLEKGKKELAELSSEIGKMARIVSIRQKNPLGLGHAVLCAEPAVGQEPFAILLGDDLIDNPVPCTRQLIDVFQEHQSSVVGVMNVPEVDVSKYGIVGGTPKSDRITEVSAVVEKPHPKDAPSRLAIPGRYVVKPEIFQHLKKVKPGTGGEIQLTDALEALAKSDRLLAYQFDGKRYDSGDRLGYLEASLVFALKRPELAPQLKRIMKDLLAEE